MSVLVTWSLTNGGASIADDVDHGGAGNGSATSAKTIYLRHDGVSAITSCKLYITSISERYDGDFTADGDLSEILGWGNGLTASAFGGLFYNLNATGSFPAASWPTLASKSVTSGGNTVGIACRTGVGDSVSNGISFVTQMGCSTNGELQAGTAPNVRFQCKFSIPADEDTLGIRHIKQVLSYSYTS